MNYFSGPFSAFVFAIDAAFILYGFYFFVSEIIRIQRKKTFPTGTLTPWKAGRGGLLEFAFLLIIVFLFCPQIGFAFARFLFPEINLAENPIYAIGFYQPLALACVWEACAAGASREKLQYFELSIPTITLRQNWNAAESLPLSARLSLRSRENIWAFFGLMLFFVVVSSLISNCVPLLFPSLKDAWAQNQILVDNLRNLEHPGILFLVVPALVVFTPIIEEILFRAGIYRFLASKTGKIPAALLTGLCFALLHDSLAGILPLMALSCVLCYAYERTGKLAVPIIMHGLFNLNTLLQIFAF